MGIIINTFVLVSAVFLTTNHVVGLADKVIIALYIMLQIWIGIVTTILISRNVRLHFGLTSFIQVIIPIFLVILYFLNGFSLVFFSPSIRIF